ncbi:MAG: glycoside hydrolase family 2 TIM barrel-domain containing protein, partial [Thermoanaerobaculia bacterium]|nr:glycoside hydrolase family 2 TIM barrel-domain containing protein [Thermoanaerobaculia bacterium]
DVAIAAEAHGSLAVEVVVTPEAVGSTLVAAVSGGHGEASIPVFEGRLRAVDGYFSTHMDAMEAWSAERPRLYFLELELRRDGDRLHHLRERFGFRSFEIAPERGLLVNGRPVRLKGINRHAFWPDSGRALDPSHSRDDAELIKSLNANAVRTSHYPPDPAFLEACDEIGLYVIDELPGWHDAYDTAVGEALVAEMVRRDRNHPSILMWANGNEGGWNADLDDAFARHDLQRRPVIHPDAVFAGLDTVHYPSWEELAERLDDGAAANRRRRLLRRPLPLVLPTEALHGLYDGGHGAGLEAYWSLLLSHRRGAGIFLWSYLDEGVVRVDRGGVLDTAGNFAPDGIVGPYREKEASYGAVRRIWSPVQVANSRIASTEEPRLLLANRFDHASLSDVVFEWQWQELPAPGEMPAEPATGGSLVGPPIAPGSAGALAVPPLPAGTVADALGIRAVGVDGRELGTWMLPVAGSLRNPPRLPLRPAAEEGVTVEVGAAGTILNGHGLVVELDGRGRLRALERDGVRVELGPGPVPASRRGAPREPSGSERLEDGVEYRLATGEWFRWHLEPGGWLRLDYRFQPRGRSPLAGVRFEVDEEDVAGMR